MSPAKFGLIFKPLSPLPLAGREFRQCSAAVEIAFHQGEDLFLIVADVGTQCAVVEGFQLGNDTVDHGGSEPPFSFVDGALSPGKFIRVRNFSLKELEK